MPGPFDRGSRDPEPHSTTQNMCGGQERGRRDRRERAGNDLLDVAGRVQGETCAAHPPKTKRLPLGCLLQRETGRATHDEYLIRRRALGRTAGSRENRVRVRAVRDRRRVLLEPEAAARALERAEAGAEI